MHCLYFIIRSFYRKHRRFFSCFKSTKTLTACSISHVKNKKIDSAFAPVENEIASSESPSLDWSCEK